MIEPKDKLWKGGNVLDLNEGFLSIESKNIFSILKKWLYTEPDITFRELVSNASDAIEKLAAIMKENGTDLEQSVGLIKVTLDPDKKIIIISDNGIGMTEEEVHKYINQIAFSGASDFINKYDNEENNSIIGHFGVGFYSAFMLADHVAIETKSYRADTKAVRWDCNADMSYKMTSINRTSSGTDIILHLNDNTPYMMNPTLVYEALKKYFVFLETSIIFQAPGYDKILINNPLSLWRQPESEIHKEEMNIFYRDFFNDTSDPLFWVKFESLDIGVRGIIYFRDTKNGTEELDGTFKIYNRGVFIDENISGMIPKFINLQNGIIECDNLPLVVSRSSINQSDHDEDILSLVYETLSQEVTIAIHDMFENKRDSYQNFWPQLNAFVKYGILQDRVFASVMAQKVIYEDIHGRYITINEYKQNQIINHKDIVYYASDALDQAHYIEIFKKCNLNALLLDHVIDQPFMRRYELNHLDTKFVRIDSNIESLFNGFVLDTDNEDIEILANIATRSLGNRLGKTELRITRLEQQSLTSLLINDEQSRRMMDLMEIYGLVQGIDATVKKSGAGSIFIMNLNNDIIKFLLKSKNEYINSLIINQLYDLALMSQGNLDVNDIEPFLSRSESLLEKLIEV